MDSLILSSCITKSFVKAWTNLNLRRMRHNRRSYLHCINESMHVPISRYRRLVCIKDLRLRASKGYLRCLSMLLSSLALIFQHQPRPNREELSS